VSWKPTAIAAVIVMAAGLAAGAAIGGRTTVVREQVTVTAEAPAPDPAPEQPGTPKPDPSPLPAEPEDAAPAAYLEEPLNLLENVSDAEVDVSARLKSGEVVERSAVFVLDSDFGSNPDRWVVEVPASPEHSVFVARVGFERRTPTNKTVTLEFLKDDTSGEPLESKFTLTANESRDVRVSMQGAAGIVLRLTPGEEKWQAPQSTGEIQFVLGNARFE